MQSKVSENNRISNGILHPAQSIHTCLDYTSDNLTFVESRVGQHSLHNIFYSRVLGKNFTCDIFIWNDWWDEVLCICDSCVSHVWPHCSPRVASDDSGDLMQSGHLMICGGRIMDPATKINSFHHLETAKMISSSCQWCGVRPVFSSWWMWSVDQITGILRDTPQPWYGVWRVTCLVSVTHQRPAIVCLEPHKTPKTKERILQNIPWPRIKPGCTSGLASDNEADSPSVSPLILGLWTKLLGLNLNYTAGPLSALAAGMTQQVRERILIFRQKSPGETREQGSAGAGCVWSVTFLVIKLAFYCQLLPAPANQSIRSLGHWRRLDIRQPGETRKADQAHWGDKHQPTMLLVCYCKMTNLWVDIFSIFKFILLYLSLSLTKFYV